MADDRNDFDEDAPTEIIEREDAPSNPDLSELADGEAGDEDDDVDTA